MIDPLAHTNEHQNEVSVQADPQHVFVSLAEVKVDSESQKLTDPTDQNLTLATPQVAIPPATPSPESVPPHASAIAAREMRDALSVLPKISDQLVRGIQLAEENDRLKAEVAAVRLMVQTPVGEAAERLRSEVERLTGIVNALRAALQAARKANPKGKDKENIPPVILPTINPDRISALAIALTEGAEATEIAGQLLDEVDRVLSGGEKGVDIEQEDDAFRLTLLGSKMEQKVHEMEGVMEVTMARITAMEEEFEEIKGGSSRR